MKLYLVLLVYCLLYSVDAKKKKLSGNEEAGPESKVKRKVNESPSAIVAIQIVDPNSKSKNSKRTIESSLGYGYQSVLGATHQQPKYEVYKYSQHDIPAYKGSGQIFTGSKKNSFRNHKYTADSYQPGTTLYSTLNQHGQLGGFSSQIPYSQSNHAGATPIPVIILRVFPNQIADGSHSLHPNLPQSHPQAAYLNPVDLQSLLSNYFHGVMMQQYVQPQVEYQPQPQYHQYQAPQSPITHSKLVHEYHQPPQYVQYQQPEPVYEPQPAYESQPAYEPQQGSLLTHENYPSDSHTKVVFRDQKGRIKQTQHESPPVQTKTIKIHVPPGISGVEVESSTVHQHSNQQVEVPQGHQEYQYVQQQQEEDPNYYYYNSQFDQQNYQQVEPQVQYQQQQQSATDAYPVQPKQYESPPEPDYSQYQNPASSQQSYQEQTKYVTPRNEHTRSTKQKRKSRTKKSNDNDTKVEGEKKEE